MENDEFYINGEKLEYVFSEQEIKNSYEENIDNTETPSVFYLNLKYQDEIYLPVTLFENKLTPSQNIVKYLRENLKLTNKKIAALLGKDTKSIWTAYDSIKNKKTIRPKETSIQIPLGIFKTKQFSPLEALAKFLKEQELTYAEIARLTGKNQRTIWTVYSRASKKIEQKKHDQQ